MKQITILLVDDDKSVRKGFRRLLQFEPDFEIIGEAENGLPAVAMTNQLYPAFVLMNFAMPELNGFDATRQILTTVPATRVIIISSHTDDAYVEAVNHSGAHGYLDKNSAAHFVSLAIREVQQGNPFYCPSINPRLHQPSRKN